MFREFTRYEVEQSLWAGSVLSRHHGPRQHLVEGSFSRRNCILRVARFWRSDRPMKRPAQWDAVSSDDSSGTDSEEEVGERDEKVKLPNSSKDASSAVVSRKKLDYDALNRHGYRGGPSILKVPPPRTKEKEQDWSWSTGNTDGKHREMEESCEERERTRCAIQQAEQLASVSTSSVPGGKKDKKNMSFSQKEKRKRDLGQASRGKNYVEEEKRLLRDNGVYSGFDS